MAARCFQKQQGDALFDAAEEAALSFRLTRDLRKRLDRYIADRVPQLSRAQAQRLIEQERVRVNGSPAKASLILKQGDLVELQAPPPRSASVEPEPVPLTVLHEDEAIIALNKQPGVLVHPARSNLHGTLVAGLLWRFREQASQGRGLSTIGQAFARPGVVHRLDRDTSGVILFAKRDDAHGFLAQQFEQRTVEKRYIALVEGVVDPAADVIDAPIGPHPNRARGYREKMVVRQDQLGKSALTIYRALERFDGYSLVEVELKTGRTHQIRVHMSHLGWPLVGDDMYGGSPLYETALRAPSGRWTEPGEGEKPLLARQALHAATLTFTHPLTRRRLTLCAPFPEDMRRAVEALRRHRPGAGRTGLSGASLDLDALLVAPARSS